jgi:hypothetical protein
MRSTILVILIAMGLITIGLASDSILQSFTAESSGDNVTVKWTTSDESIIKRFEIERSVGDQNYKRIHSVIAKGSPSNYSYRDDEAFMKDDIEYTPDLQSQNFYSYRIKIIANDNTATFSDVAYVKHNTSSIRRTWGMIKEMFR